MPDLTGGCLCGAIRYRLDPAGGVVDYCHCGQCRKAGGAATVAWIQVPPAAFAVTAGTASAFATAVSTRHFCGRCGSPLFMTDPDGRSVGVTLGTLDDPNAVAPTAHGWDSARPRWLALSDGLPRFACAPPYDER